MIEASSERSIQTASTTKEVKELRVYSRIAGESSKDTFGVLVRFPSSLLRPRNDCAVGGVQPPDSGTGEPRWNLNVSTRTLAFHHPIVGSRDDLANPEGHSRPSSCRPWPMRVIHNPLLERALPYTLHRRWVQAPQNDLEGWLT